jgi:hypothetical protein
MSKSKLEVNFHYGQQNFNELMKKVISNKLKMDAGKELLMYNKNTQSTAICQK